MKFQILFSGKNKKNIICLMTAEFTKNLQSVNTSCVMCIA